MKKVEWILGALVYSFLVAISPMLILMFSELFFLLTKKLNEIVSWVVGNNLNGWIFYGITFVLGLYIQFCKPLFKRS